MTPDTNKERADFEAWANGKGYDIAGTYDTDRSRWVWLNPMTADLWHAWQARASLAANAPAAPTHAAQRDELLQAAIDFIGTLTGMTPPPIEVAPPEVFAPFYEFVDRVQAITGAAPPAPTEQWVSVAERLPNPHQEVLLVIDGGHVTTGSYMPNLHCFCWEPCDDEREDSAVTHWMTKPAPPQGAANKDES